MVTLTKHVIPGPDLHCARHLRLWKFLQHLPAKYKGRPKKSYYLRAGSGTVPYGKSGDGYFLKSIKSLDEVTTSFKFPHLTT